MTVQIDDTGNMLVCHTRDISREGCFLDTVEQIPVGHPLKLVLMDPDRGEVIEAEGRVQRELAPRPDGKGRGVGVFFPEPSESWTLLVARHARDHTLPGIGTGKSVRLRGR